MFRDIFTIFRPYEWWQLLIEWFLIGFVVYWVIRFLRGTRGARLLKGIGVVLIVLYLIVKIVATQFCRDWLASDRVKARRNVVPRNDTSRTRNRESPVQLVAPHVSMATPSLLEETTQNILL